MDTSLVLETGDSVNLIRLQYQCSTTDIEQMIVQIREWLTKQPHLPHDQDDSLLERFLQRNKFQLERTKRKMTGYYELRSSGHMRHFFRTASSLDLLPKKQAFWIVPMPKLTDSTQVRVFVARFEDSNPDHFNATDNVAAMWLAFELLLRYDYSNGDLFIVDCASVKLSHVVKMLMSGRPTKLYKHYQDGYSGRLFGLYHINPPSCMSAIITCARTVLPTKFYDKIKVFSKLDDLYRFVDVNQLPKEYGGTLPSLDVLQERWSEFFQMHHDVMDQSLKQQHAMVTKEKVNDSQCQGSFRSLNFD